MSSQVFWAEFKRESAPYEDLDAIADQRRWYAVFTVPQNEKSVVRHLNLRSVESFVPTYETIRVWKNRQRVTTVLPLFPCYVFVHINPRERVKVLGSPGVLRMVGNGRQYVPLEEAEIELLRSGFSGRKLEPFQELVIGEKVRIKAGLLQGVEGSIDFTLPNYLHDTRTIYSSAGGVDYRFSGHIVIRGDYEYQFWTHFIHNHTMNPQGLTIGVNYDFGHRRRFEGLPPNATY